MVSGLSEHDAQEFWTSLNFEDGPHKKHAAERRICVQIRICSKTEGNTDSVDQSQQVYKYVYKNVTIADLT
jgi:hypothetical protein